MSELQTVRDYMKLRDRAYKVLTYAAINQEEVRNLEGVHGLTIETWLRAGKLDGINEYDVTVEMNESSDFLYVESVVYNGDTMAHDANYLVLSLEAFEKIEELISNG